MENKENKSKIRWGIDENLWKILDIYHMTIKQKSRDSQDPQFSIKITKGELINKSLKEFLKKAYENSEFKITNPKLKKLLDD